MMKLKTKDILIGILLAIVAAFNIIGGGILLFNRGDISGLVFILLLGLPSAFLSFGFLESIHSTEEELKSQKQLIENTKAEFKWEYKDNYFRINNQVFHVSEVEFYDVEVATYKSKPSKGIIYCTNGKKYSFSIAPSRLDEAIKIRTKFALDKVSCKKSNSEYDPKKVAEARDKMVDFLTTDPALNPKKEEKKASVVGRAVVGGIIAGETGAVVGALSAVDKNNKKK